jgi:ribosomal-protein-alanine N-acetyltransferase
MLPVLQIRRLVLRPQSPSDLADYHALLTDPGAGPFAPSPPGSLRETEERLARQLARQDAGDLMSWGLRPDGGSLVGSIFFVRIVRDHRRSEVGYRLRSDQRGKGLMTEALERLVEHGFRDLGFHRLAGYTSPENRASIGVLERCGFRFEGVLCEDFFMDGAFHDSAVYARLADATV